MTDKNWNGHDKNVQAKMAAVSEEGPDLEQACDELYDVLTKNYQRYYNALHEDSPLKAYLDYETRDALVKIKDTAPAPLLFASTIKEIECMNGQVMSANTAVRITMASQIGDVGITLNLEAESGYSARVSLNSLHQYRTTMHCDKNSKVPHFTQVMERTLGRQL